MKRQTFTMPGKSRQQTKSLTSNAGPHSVKLLDFDVAKCLWSEADGIAVDEPEYRLTQDVIDGVPGVLETAFAYRGKDYSKKED